MNPDGTGLMVFFGNQHPNVVMIDAKPIPGTRKVVASFSPGHGRTEHAGAIAIIDPDQGPDAKDMARTITKGHNYRDPYPLSENLFLVATNHAIELIDDLGNSTVLWSMPEDWRTGRMCVHEPRPLAAREKEYVMALQRPPSMIEPFANVPDLIDFPRDIQPLLDKYCVACHDYDASPRGGPMSGGLIFSGDHGPMFSHSYYNLTISGQYIDGRNLRKSD